MGEPHAGQAYSLYFGDSHDFVWVYLYMVECIARLRKAGKFTASTAATLAKDVPYLPVYNVHPCIMHTPILKPVFRKKKHFNIIILVKK